MNEGKVNWCDILNSYFSPSRINLQNVECAVCMLLFMTILGSEKTPFACPNSVHGKGYIDVGDKWMLVTMFECWRQSFVIGDIFECWCPTLMLKGRGCW